MLRNLRTLVYWVLVAAFVCLVAANNVIGAPQNEANNQQPVLDPIGPQSTTEGVNLNFGVSATDPDGTIPTLFVSFLPPGAAFVDNGDGSGYFDWTPGFTQSGIYCITFYATDGILLDSEVVCITVYEAGNQMPELDPIGSKSTTEEVNLNFVVSATDPDGTIPSLSTSPLLPSGAVFFDNGDGSGYFDWTPGLAQAGTYSVIFYASDGALQDSEVVSITVFDAEPPASVESLYVNASSSSLHITSEINSHGAPDGAEASISFKLAGKRSQTWTFDFDNTTVSSLDILSADIFLTHRQSGYKDDSLVLEYFDGTSFVPFESFANVPNVLQTVGPFAAGALTSSDQIDNFQVRMRGVSKAHGPDRISYFVDAIQLRLEYDVNSAPVLNPIDSQTTTEGVNLNFGVSATDPDGTIPFLSTSPLPSGAVFVDNGDGSGYFDWTPGFTQSGIYCITFYATDGILLDSQVVCITVQEAGNQPPVLDSIGPQWTQETINLNFGVSATDPDGTIPSLNTSPLPSGALFIDNNDGTGYFDWTPDFTQSGQYSVTFYASDGVLVDSEVVSITVLEIENRPPVLDSIGPKSIAEEANLNFVVSATDPDETIPALSTSSLPSGAVFVDNGNGSGVFDWTPDSTQSGEYNVTFYAYDGLLMDSEVVSITVLEAGDHPPVLNPIDSQTTIEGVNLNFGVSATDPNGTIPVLSTSSLPSGAGFVDNGDGSGVFDWTPGFMQSGQYSVTFYASDGVLVDSEVVSIAVLEVGNQPPVLDSIGPKSTTEGVNLNFGVSATDPDGTIPSLSTSPLLPSGAVFFDNGDGSGYFDWTPDLTQSGSYDVTFYATDGILVDSEVVTITVAEFGVSKNSSESPDNLPESYSLGQNYPNPFNPTTEITFALPAPSDVRLEIFNILGQKVATLVNSQLEAGRHTVTWNSSNVGSGIYFYRFESKGYSETRKMVLLK